MQRREDWSRRLDEVVQLAVREPFAYGTHDCVTFAARCVDAMCDTDLVAGLANEYRDEASGLAFLSRGGWLGLVPSWLDGCPAISWKFAQPGDVVLLPSHLPEWGLGVGIVYGHSIIHAAIVGLAQTPIDRAQAAWAVGRTA